MARRIKGEDGRVYVEKKRGGCFKWLMASVVIFFLVPAIYRSFNEKEYPPVTQVTETADANEPEFVESSEVVEIIEDNQPEVPKEFKNALDKGQMYSDMMDMSKAGVLQQLTSQYGEKFPDDAAQYAIDNINADWNENALNKAKTYYDTMSMSKDAVYTQLTSSYGEQFTAEEAQYAIDNLE